MGLAIPSGRRTNLFRTATFWRGIFISFGLGGVLFIFALSGLYVSAYLTTKRIDGEVVHLLARLQNVLEHDTAEAFVDYIDKRKNSFPNLLVLVAQRNKVKTLRGKEQFQTRWRAGTLRFVIWPVVPPYQPEATSNDRTVGGGAPRAAPAPYLSDWITMTAYRGGQNAPLIPLRMRARYAYFPQGETPGQPGLLLIVGRDKMIGDENLARVAELGLIMATFIAIFVGLSAVFTSNFVVGRIDKIGDTANEIIGGDLSRRVPVGKSSNEFDRLSLTLNRMLDRIERLVSGVREVSDNIAHDLRTPLVRMRSRIELALLDVDTKESPTGPRDALEAALGEADRLLTTFNALMSIARLEAGAVAENAKREDISSILRDLTDLYEPAAEERGLKLRTNAPLGLFVNCNHDLIMQALSNLIDNALKYSPEGTSVTLSARHIQPERGPGRAVEISVVDEGPGIPKEDRERVLKRFVRLERGRGAPGSGLGLSLVAAIMQAHEGTLTLEDGVNGKGLAVRIVMPEA